MIIREQASIIRNARIAEDIFLTVFQAQRIASDAQPGQFIALAPRAEGSILNRPMAIYDADPHAGTVAIGYHVIGANTKKYSALAQGEKLTIIGPLGSVFHFDLSYDHFLLVGGGIGITSLHLIGKHLSSRGKKVTTLIGARTKDLVACRDDFAKFGEVRTATDDGSDGHHGYVNALLDQEAKRASGEKIQAIYCGPHLMMKSCAETCRANGIAHLAVMEEMMACGVGICVACVCQTAEGQKKVCLDGPIFDGSKIQWTREQTSVMHE